MKKYFIMILVSSILFNHAYASDKNIRICVLQKKVEVIATAEHYAHNYNLKDKFMHCSCSCMLKLKCGTLEAGMAGFMKEVLDLFDNKRGNSFGSGDLKADYKGLNYANSSSTDDDCLYNCHSFYP